jgi:hypothetical protein
MTLFDFAFVFLFLYLNRLETSKSQLTMLVSSYSCPKKNTNCMVQGF